MIGAILALILIGLMRFGMGLVNVQGQVQSIAIGLLLIFSILLPNVAQQLSRRGMRLRRSAILSTADDAVLIAGFFIWFFFWSRVPILNLTVARAKEVIVFGESVRRCQRDYTEKYLR